MKALVTGASGFVGSAVVRALLSAGHDVRVVVRKSSTLANIADLPVERVEGDLLAPASLHGIMAGCDALFHVAADYRLWVPNPEAMFRANVDGTRALMEEALAAGVGRVVYTSSVATLGIVPGGVADEQTKVSYADMIGPYKQSKFRAEDEVWRLIRAGLPAVIVNPSTPVGPRDIKPTPTGRLVRDAARGRIPAYVDTGLNVVHVDDVAQGHLLACLHGRIGERYILGGDNLTLAEILTLIARIAGRRPPSLRLSRHWLWPVAAVSQAYARVRPSAVPLVTWDELRMAAKHMFFDSAKAQRELGYRPRPAADALADAVAWFLAAGHAGQT
ncbi:hopanoid-associated sugar epimerase [Acidiferrobacter sp.]|uniref:hopanoid-associated sugar epimerase n=1 Tax=Acidiferrobacter sp. TaxID=1872107 RepID=UPI00262DE2CB|nr:hopanoid-associated sugar epimerase [Acidiferrobacter sp.]